MADPPKKRILTGLDIANAGKARSTRIPTAKSAGKIHKRKIRYKRICIDAGILAGIIIVAYALSFLGGFIFNDHYINQFINIKISDENFWSNLVMKAISQPLAQPWITASFALDMQNFALDAFWYHLVNIILHFLSCFYFYIFVYRLAKHFWSTGPDDQPLHAVPLLAAALLACHPLACESVAHITGRPATIIACNFFLALNFFLSGFLSTRIDVTLINYVLTFIFFLLAIFSDCQGLSLPAVMFFLAFLLKATNLNYKSWLQKRWPDFVFITFLAILAGASATHGFTAEFSNGFALPMPKTLVYVTSQFRALTVYYLRCLLFPLGLSIYPPFVTAGSVIDLFAIAGLTILAATAYLTYRLRKEPLAAFGLGLAVMSFLPSIFFVQNEIAADRRFYLCIAGLSLLLAAKLKSWLAPEQKQWQVKAYACLFIVMLSVITAARTCDFRSDIGLLTAATRVNKEDPWAKGMLALSLVNDKKCSQAIPLAQQAIKANNTCQPAYLALGKAALPYNPKQPGAAEMYREAKPDLETALSLAKSQHLGPSLLFDSQTSLASALIELNDYQRTKELAAEALTFNKNSILLNLIMGRSLNGLGQYLEALRYLDRGFSRDQTNPDYVEPLTEAGLGAGTASTVSMAYNTAKLGLRLRQSPKLHLLLARAALSMRRFPESVQWGDIALKEEPNNAQAMYLRSYQLQITGKIAQAKELRARALKLEPDLATKMPIVIVNKESNSVTLLDKLISPMF